MRRTTPSSTIAVISEIPTSIFYTLLLTYWLLGVTRVRVSARKLKDKDKGDKGVSLNDIVGKVSPVRLLVLVILLVLFVYAQTMLHIRYLKTETNRAVFSSFQHFKTSEDIMKDPGTILLIFVNIAFGVIYIILYIFEVCRSLIDLNRLPYTHKVGHIFTAIMVFFTLLVLFGKFSRAGGFHR